MPALKVTFVVPFAAIVLGLKVAVPPGIEDKPSTATVTVPVQPQRVISPPVHCTPRQHNLGTEGANVPGCANVVVYFSNKLPLCC